MSKDGYDYHHSTSNAQFLALLIAFAGLGGLVLALAILGTMFLVFL